MRGERALVLGGGGIAGLGWLAGLICGLFDEGVDLRDADRMIGTSAGAATAAQLRSSRTIERLYARQTESMLIADEQPPPSAKLMPVLRAYPTLMAIPDGAGRVRAMNDLARSSETAPPQERRAMIERRLADHGWPQAALTITAVDAEEGKLVAFDASSGVDLVDAVNASCAVPGVWPVVEIGGRAFMDGGVWSADNAQLAAGSARALILSPLGQTTSFTDGFRLADQVAGLEGGGSRVLVIEPDAAARAAIGANPLDPAIRGPSAKAGRAQGEAVANQVHSFWKGD